MFSTAGDYHPFFDSSRSLSEAISRIYNHEYKGFFSNSSSAMKAIKSLIYSADEDNPKAVFKAIKDNPASLVHKSGDRAEWPMTLRAVEELIDFVFPLAFNDAQGRYQVPNPHNVRKVFNEIATVIEALDITSPAKLGRYQDLSRENIEAFAELAEHLNKTSLGENPEAYRQLQRFSKEQVELMVCLFKAFREGGSLSNVAVDSIVGLVASSDTKEQLKEKVCKSDRVDFYTAALSLRALQVEGPFADALQATAKLQEYAQYRGYGLPHLTTQAAQSNITKALKDLASGLEAFNSSDKLGSEGRKFFALALPRIKQALDKQISPLIDVMKPILSKQAGHQEAKSQEAESSHPIVSLFDKVCENMKMAWARQQADEIVSKGEVAPEALVEALQQKIQAKRQESLQASSSEVKEGEQSQLPEGAPPNQNASVGGEFRVASGTGLAPSAAAGPSTPAYGQGGPTGTEEEVGQNGAQPK